MPLLDELLQSRKLGDGGQNIKVTTGPSTSNKSARKKNLWASRI
jgi:hypothetical protein